MCVHEVGEEEGVADLFSLVCDFSDWVEDIVGIVSLRELKVLFVFSFEFL